MSRVQQVENFDGTWYVAQRKPGGFWVHSDAPHGREQAITLEPGTYRMILIDTDGVDHAQSTFTLRRARKLTLRTFVREFQWGGLILSR